MQGTRLALRGCGAAVLLPWGKLASGIEDHQHNQHNQHQYHSNNQILHSYIYYNYGIVTQYLSVLSA